METMGDNAGERVVEFSADFERGFAVAHEVMEIMGDTEGIRLIAEERRRQIQVEGFGDEHDDQHKDNELLEAADSYLLQARLPPWDASRWKPKDRRADLVRAGALIAAELDRMARQEKRAKQVQQAKSAESVKSVV